MHGDVFRNEICNCPDDDAPRLVYADWLEEQGDPYGEFIRVQCELAAEEDLDVERRDFLEAREAELRITFEEDWVAPLKSVADRWAFRRGFVEYVELPLEAFLEHQATLRQFPITHLTLTQARQDFAQLAQLPALNRLRGLCLDESGLIAYHAEVLAESPYLGNLERLSLSRNQLGDEGVAALASAQLGRLAVLDLSWNDFGNQGIKALTRSPHLRQLETLVVNNNRIRLLGARALAAARQFENLRFLDVRRNKLDGRGLDVLRERFGIDFCLA